MEIICPHCQARHMAEAEVCPVCGTPVAPLPVAGATSPPASMVQRAAPTAPVERAGVTVPMAYARATARRHAPALIAPWRLVLLGIAVPLLLAPAAVYAMQRLASRAFPGSPTTLPTATVVPAIWTPGSATPSAAPAPTATRAPHLATATAGGSPGGSTSPTATQSAPTATPTTLPPTATATMVLPTATSTPYNQG